MPFDSLPIHTEAPLKPFTLPHFLRWLNGRDPAEQYNQNSTFDCLLCRYGLENGVSRSAGNSPWRETRHKFPEADYAGAIDAAYGPYEEPEQSVGAALQRAEQALKGER